MSCLNSPLCSSATTGDAPSTFLSAVQFFAAAQCLLTEGTYPDANVINNATYDFIVVGAGSSGSVLASRLSEVPEWKVLLIEAGGDPPIEAVIPGLQTRLYHSKYNWGYKSVNDGIINQGFINGTIEWTRAKMVGGCSNINAMLYVQGNDEDYRAWNIKEWSVEEVRRCYKKIENFQDDRLNEITEIYTHYGHNGPLVINSFNQTQKPVNDRILSAWNEIGVKNVDDLNTANCMGSGNFRATASNGERNSVSKAYLQPAKGRSNLSIMKNALVTKVLVDSSNNAYGVVVQQNNQQITVTATSEVILSAGAINSPQLLMLSGIGPQTHLQSKNVPVVTNLPMVGQNLQDHIVLPVTIYTNESNIGIEPNTQFQAIEYLFNRTGYLAHLKYGYGAAFYSLDQNGKYPDFEVYCVVIPRNSSGLKQGLTSGYNYVESIADSIVELNKNTTLYQFLVSPLHPYSSGNISLSSNNPNDFPNIYANYFSDSRDLDTTVSGMQRVLKLLDTTFFKSVQGFHGRMKLPECDKFGLDTPEYLKCIAKNLAGTVYHPMGTCKMGTDANDSVVNGRLKVHGIGNLRVADASVMPGQISGNIHAPCIMIGERAAELIKEDYNKLQS